MSLLGLQAHSQLYALVQDERGARAAEHPAGQPIVRVRGGKGSFPGEERKIIRSVRSFSHQGSSLDTGDCCGTAPQPTLLPVLPLLLSSMNCVRLPLPNQFYQP